MAVFADVEDFGCTKCWFSCCSSVPGAGGDVGGSHSGVERKVKTVGRASCGVIRGCH